MLEQVRNAAVKGIRPLIGDRAWETLKRLDRANAKSADGGLVDAAGTADQPLRRAVRDLLADLDHLLADRPRARVLVVADTVPTPLAELVQACYPDARVTTVVDGPEDPGSHARLAAGGPYDLLVDVVVDRADPVQLYRSGLFHLRRGGHLVLAGFRPGSPQRRELWSLVTRLVALRDPGSGLAAEDADEEALARATGRVVVDKRYLIVRNATRSLAKVREAEIGTILALTGERVGTVQRTIEAESFAPRSVVRDHGRKSRTRVQPPIEVPALSLRRYRGVTCAPAQVVVKRNLLLPETYRHHLQGRLVNRATKEIAPRFARVKRDLGQPERLSGSYFHLDLEWPGHYGHVLTELMSRLWGWEAAKAQDPDLRVLLGRRPGHDRALPFELSILAALGIPEGDVTLLDRPVRVEHLVAATPMFSMPHYVSPGIASIWDAVGQAVGASAADEPTPRRFFCGRDRETRRCHNAAEVEERFAEAGFVTVFPERMDFATQVAMFVHADVVAGYAGSALFTLLFCARPKRVLMLSSESYRANNEYLLGAVRGHEFDVFWSRADSRSQKSHFTFDFDREGRHLERVLAELDPVG